MVDQSERPAQKGRLFIFSSPSGGGKDTIISHLLKNKDFIHSVSATTRPIREEEVNGKSYWFLIRDEFLKMRDRGEFLEWEEVYGNYYGTPKKPVEEAINKGFHVLFDLDVKGALKMKETYPDARLIFLMPPSLEILKERLRKRGSEDEEGLQSRLAEARWECDQASKYDDVVENDQLETTIKAVEKIIQRSL